MGKWQKLSSKYVYENPWIKIREDQVIQPNGKPSIYGVVEVQQGPCVIPVDKDRKIWMIRQYRYIFDDIKWEFVAGEKREHETPEAAGLRELQEELNLTAGSIKLLGQFRPSNGSTNEHDYILLAEDLEPYDAKSDEPDILERKAFTLAEIDEMIKRGEILDGFTICAMYFYKCYIDSESERAIL